MRVLALLLIATLMGCSSQYIMSTHDGRLIATDSKPKLDPETDMYVFKDADGREQMIPKADIQEIIER